jgi:NAD-dependent deacetylase
MTDAVVFDDVLIKNLREAENVVFFTGAGASEESGIPTFRSSIDGLWGNFDENDYATLDGFTRNPTKVWQWYKSHRQSMAALQPNLAHHVIARWQEKTPNVTVITQNIDNFHQDAGSDHVIELHGNIHHFKCLNDHPVESSSVDMAEETPLCEICGSLVRPDLVWFNEPLPQEAFDLAEVYSRESSVFIAVGCSMEVQPAALLPIYAVSGGAFMVQINPIASVFDKYAYTLRGKAGEILPQLWQAIWGEAFS